MKSTDNPEELHTDPDQDDDFKVDDRRHWARDDESNETAERSTEPTLIDQFRQRASDAEQKLQEYIEAHKRFKEEQEGFRTRLNRDVDRRVELKFGEMIGELLEFLDILDLALDHAGAVPEAQSLAEGVRMARSKFLATLESHGVEKLTLEEVEFDPNEAEALRIDAVDDPKRNNKVTETLRPGYRLGDRVLRAAQVAVGRHSSSS